MLPVTVVSFVFFQNINAKDEVFSEIEMPTTSSITKMSDLYTASFDVVQIKVLDKINANNSFLKYENNDKKRGVEEFYSMRKVELLSDSIKGLKKGLTLNLMQMAAVNEKKQILKLEDVMVLQEGKEYSLFISKAINKNEMIIPSHRYSIREYNAENRNAESGDRLATLIHTLYKSRALSERQIEQIAFADEIEGLLNIVKTPEVFMFDGLKNGMDQFAHAYFASDNYTYIEYGGTSYRVNGNVMGTL